MKRILFILLLFSWNLDAQTIFRVNNSPGVTGVNVYTTIQDAHDAASDGDIIYVEPSLDTYGALLCTKRLTILGNGYFHNQNENDSYETKQSILEKIVFDIGSDSSVVRGLTITNQGGEHGSSIEGEGVKKIQISNCRILGAIYFDYYYDYDLNINKRCSEWIIINNFCKELNATSIIQAPHPTNLVISNNLMEYAANIGGGSLIYNNTLYATGGNSGLWSIYGSEVFNNIIQTTSCDNCGEPITLFTDAATVNTNVYNNILIYDDMDDGWTPQWKLPEGNGNVSNVEKGSVFIIPNPDIYSEYDWADKNYILNPSSPAKGIGVNNVDAGAFGGVNPYVLAGQIPYPIITDFKSTGAGNASVPLQIDITVKGNN
ncbi:hypothetical protein [Arcticibacterium luteifluviistationis]|uniref:Right handed beta helix domain-containing protein n=1 Tax=Arcticibacterium luteifluviistationis TaxID=1784714 RepID=A0A2Z4G9D8_9BACT|nr:hypothetical protein [Arcticibacterium luteifluviistationis]AWV97543.1 hypothetical protein DJ013_04930 [Arcticibacterium luteifluviistationis]